jgi:uncharacterized membrane protein YedE/YeeE
MIEMLSKPWPWYVAGPLIGLTVPFLLIIGNKTFGISSSLRHMCAAIIPAGISYFKYEWKKEIWNLLFVGGIVLGGIFAVTKLANPQPLEIDQNLKSELATYGISDYSNAWVPADIVNWQSLLSLKGFFFIIVGGFLIGFGTRYANGCTSGHSITGLAALQWPSLVATICFMAGGFFAANVLIPFILKF